MRRVEYGIRVSAVVALCVLGAAGSTYAQSGTATLSGVVVDESNAVIPDVAVSVLARDTGAQRERTTNDQGQFTFAALPPGRYTARATRHGFTPVEVPDVTLNVNDTVSIRLQLKVEDVGESVTITATPTRLNMSPAVSTVVDRQFVANMPLNGRSFQSLIALTPGVVFGTAGNDAATGGQFAVNGQRTNSNYFTVDGVSANHGITASGGGFVGQSGSGSLPALTALGGTNSILSVDALQEFTIQTSSYAPEFGRVPGGQIQLATRSGTNSVHGTLFDYLRNDVLDANDWFANRSALPKPKNRQNDFGGVIGGPVVRNRTFFFFSYEGLRLRQPTTGIATVPTMEARERVAQVVRPFFDAFPVPNLPAVGDSFAQFAASYSDPATLDTYLTRIDHALTDTMTVFGTHKHSVSEARIRTGPLNRISTRHTSNDDVTLGFTWLASPAMTNEMRFNWGRSGAISSFAADSFGGAVVPDDSVLFTPPQNRNNALLTVSARNAQGEGLDPVAVGLAQDNLQRQINVVNTFSWVTGSHRLKAGIDYRRISPALTSASSTGLGFEILPEPTLSSVHFNVHAPGANIAVFNNFGAYVQDTWAISPRWSVTYGLRWDVNASPYSANGRDAAVLQNIDGPGPATLAPPGTRLYKTQYRNFAPRVGMSYQLSQKPGREMVVRGGVGTFYDLGTGVLATQFGNVYPYLATRSYENVSYPLDPTVVPPRLGVDPPQYFFVAAPDLKLPYTIQWNAAIEQSLGEHQTLTVSYVGAAGRRLLRILTLSQTTVEGFGSALIPYALTMNDGWSDYRAAQFQFQRRLSNGVQGMLSYTWGRSYDTSSSDTSSPGTASRFTRTHETYGPSDFDVRHIVSGALTVDIPGLRGSRVVTAMTEGWGVDALYRFRSALPTTLTTYNIIDGEFTENRPNVTRGVPQILEGPEYPGGKAVNPAAFSIPADDTVGDFPRNSLRFFNASQLDLALRRQFRITHGTALQLRIEFFNVLNQPNFASPVGFDGGNHVSTQVLSRGMGGLNPLYQIGGPRSGQVALKLTF